VEALEDEARQRRDAEDEREIDQKSCDSGMTHPLGGALDDRDRHVCQDGEAEGQQEWERVIRSAAAR
jgi:hypothetical protein